MFYLEENVRVHSKKTIKIYGYNLKNNLRNNRLEKIIFFIRRRYFFSRYVPVKRVFLLLFGSILNICVFSYSFNEYLPATF